MFSAFFLTRPFCGYPCLPSESGGKGDGVQSGAAFIVGTRGLPIPR
jgi:hypothetical protein